MIPDLTPDFCHFSMNRMANRIRERVGERAGDLFFCRARL
jgi:hypothetical protein